MDIFNLYRNFWDFAFENPDKIRPNHVAIYSFAIEHCNRLGWKKSFGFPTSMVLEATGIKSYSVFKKTFDELVAYGFISVIEYSKNQYSSNVIALKENCKANCKALDKALIKHISKQVQSTHQSIVSIDIQETSIQNTSLQETNTQKGNEILKAEIISILSFDEFWNLYDKKVGDKTKLKKMWDSVPEVERHKIKDHIPMYLMSRPDKKYRKDPQTYLNNKSWNDEIIIDHGTQRQISKEGANLERLAADVYKHFGTER